LNPPYREQWWGGTDAPVTFPMRRTCTMRARPGRCPDLLDLDVDGSAEPRHPARGLSAAEGWRINWKIVGG
jgi:hypothetical protein